MITVNVAESRGQITGFRVTGHAGSGKAGTDIVCAAVSVLVLNAVNSCEQLLGITLPVEDDGETMVCHIPAADRTAEVQLLLRSMVFGIEQTAREHGRHVRLRRQVAKDRG